MYKYLLQWRLFYIISIGLPVTVFFIIMLISRNAIPEQNNMFITSNPLASPQQNGKTGLVQNNVVIDPESRQPILVDELVILASGTGCSLISSRVRGQDYNCCS